jgi:excisionase family DNA binding protein
MIDGDLDYALKMKVAAAMLSVSTETLRRWEHRGLIRLVRVGQVVRVPASEIERLLSTR